MMNVGEYTHKIDVGYDLRLNPYVGVWVNRMLPNWTYWGFDNIGNIIIGTFGSYDGMDLDIILLEAFLRYGFSNLN